MAAVDLFLKLEGIDGESQDVRHRGEIDVQSFGWGVQQAGSAAGAPLGLPARPGKARANFQDLTFTHKIDKSSPKLVTACAQGAHIATAQLTVRKAGTQQQEFLKIKLSDVTVSSMTLASSVGDTIPLEVVTLRYGQIEITYAAQKPDGSLDTPITASCTVD